VRRRSQHAVEIKLKQLEREGQKSRRETKKELYDSVRATYDTKPTRATPPPALGRRHHRSRPHPRRLDLGPRSASLNPEIREFKTGVLQS